MSFTQSELAGGILAWILGFISLACSILTLHLIRLQPKLSNFGYLVIQLTVSQAIYDASFLFLPWYQNVVCINIINFMATYGGTATSIWSNVMSFVVVFVVIKRKTLDIISNIYYIAITVNVFALIFGIFEVYYYPFKEKLLEVDTAYYIFRIISIVVNVICFIVVTFKMYQLESGIGEKSQMNPLRTLTDRFKYYPLCQVVVRSGAIWYEMAYGFSTSSYRHPTSTLEWISFILFSISTPLAGITYFAVFLIMQPMAYDKLKELIKNIFSRNIIGENADNAYLDSTKPSIGGKNSRVSKGYFSNFSKTFNNNSLDSMELSSSINNPIVQDEYGDNNNSQNPSDMDRSSDPVIMYSRNTDNSRNTNNSFSGHRDDLHVSSRHSDAATLPAIPSHSNSKTISSAYDDELGWRLFSDEQLEEEIAKNFNNPTTLANINTIRYDKAIGSRSKSSAI